jgi:hypothetical protein
MKELLDKLSSYNLFNYLLPGTLFAAVAERTSDHRVAQGNIVVELFVYYFIGLVVSRIGSLVLEPAMKRTRFVRFAPYRDFVRACTHDPKIETLSEQNNTYRTLCALFLALGGLKLYDIGVKWWGLPGRTLILVALFLLFAFSYRKQTNYVKQRVEVAKKD